MSSTLGTRFVIVGETCTDRRGDLNYQGDGFYRTKHVISHDLGWVEANQVIIRRNIMMRDWWKRNQVMHHDQGLVENESGDWWKTTSHVRGLIIRRNIMGGPYGCQISSTRAIPGPRAMIVRQDDSYRRTPLTLTSFVMPNQDPETVKQYKDEWYVKNREAILKRKQQHPAAKKKQQQPRPKRPPSPKQTVRRKELNRQACNRYRDSHREKVRAISRTYYHSNRERIV